VTTAPEQDWTAFDIAAGIQIGGEGPFPLFAGPCAVESPETVMAIAEELGHITAELGMPLIFKASFDKANRTSINSFRGLGMETGLAVLRDVKERYGLPVVTDVHETHDVEATARVADVIQIPAFLCRQTDLLLEAGRTGKPVKIKKGQFVAPQDMWHAVEKVRSTGNDKVILTERGTAFGYNNLVVDMRGLAIMRQYAPVVFDATHSVQLPGGMGDRSGGQAEFVAVLARSAAAAGVDGFFMETHIDPPAALSDGPNMVRLSDIGELLRRLQAIVAATNGRVA
jgi:2-dehydro-3-deoxyphosphooctonate aldolase (KDO 8-P synthase)